MNGLSSETVVANNGDPLRVPVLGVSRDFFEALQVHPIVGRTFTSQENRLGGPQVVMVSYRFWTTSMGGHTLPGHHSSRYRAWPL